VEILSKICVKINLLMIFYKIWRFPLFNIENIMYNKVTILEIQQKIW